MRYAGNLLLLLVLFNLSVGLRGQTSNSNYVGIVQMEPTLGNSTVALSGPWKFHVGDNMAWADQDFDDSAWGTIDLTPKKDSAETELGSSEYIPGWTAQGYPNQKSGFAWYRLRINVHNSHGRLAIKMPDEVDDAYQVYVNGQFIGEFGKFRKHSVTIYSTLPKAFQLPPELSNGPMTISVRTWMDSSTQFLAPDSGGLHGPPILGRMGVIHALVKEVQTAAADVLFGGTIEILPLMLVCTVAVILFWMDRTEPAYLWLSLVCAVTILGNGVILIINFVPWITLTSAIFLQAIIFSPIRIGLWVIFWGYWFRMGRMQWIHRVVWGLVALTMIGAAMMNAPLYGEHVPVHAAAYLTPILLGLRLCFGVVLCAITVQGIRKQKTEGWLAFSAVLLVAIALFQTQLRLLHIKTAFDVLGFTLQLGTISTVFFLFLITVMLVRRFLHTQRIREQWKAEIEQARQIQHVLIPEQLPKTPGLAIESEYRPAREVGGDFFQILPVQEDGKVLIVVGDVTGKGLQAGMLVALIVGAIRTAVQYDSDPLGLMNILNDRLCGRGRASATCLILQIRTDGRLTLANAGHLPPYLNGNEIEMGGSLPIGVVPGAEFFVSHFTLAPGDTLMLMSDGVAEAQDQHKRLFGFERIKQMLQQPISAAELASAAQEFGQEDDILVLRIQRQPDIEGRINAATVVVAT
jgi:Stage II sporulation protein E (SpoIIE)